MLDLIHFDMTSDRDLTEIQYAYPGFGVKILDRVNFGYLV